MESKYVNDENEDQQEVFCERRRNKGFQCSSLQHITNDSSSHAKKKTKSVLSGHEATTAQTKRFCSIQLTSSSFVHSKDDHRNGNLGARQGACLHFGIKFPLGCDSHVKLKAIKQQVCCEAVFSIPGLLELMWPSGKILMALQVSKSIRSNMLNILNSKQSSIQLNIRLSKNISDTNLQKVDFTNFSGAKVYVTITKSKQISPFLHNLSAAAESGWRGPTGLEVDRSCISRPLSEKSFQKFLDVMNEHLCSGVVQTNAYCILGWLAASCHHRTMISKYPDCVKMVLDGMRMHESSVKVQEQGCAALRIFSLNSLMKTMVSDQGGIAVLIRSTRNFSANEFILEQACGALWFLSAFNNQNQDEILKFGGIDIIIKAMNRFPSCPAIQEQCCGALGYLAFENEIIQEKIANENGIEGIVLAMKNHPNKAGIQAHGCGGLWSLARGSIENRARIIESGALELVQLALQKHTSSQVVGSAKILLRMFE
eukprot:125208-Hanusia_phi.AAC.1